MDDTKRSSFGVGNSGRDHGTYYYHRDHRDDSGNATLSATEKHVSLT